MGEGVGFIPGKVVQHRPEVQPPPGKPGGPCIAAYEVQLLQAVQGESEKRRVFAPKDDDTCVRLRGSRS